MSGRAERSGQATDAPPTRKPSLRTKLVRAAATAIALGAWWLVAGDSLHGVGDAVARIPMSAFAVGLALMLTNFVVAAMRFRTLLHAYGAGEHVPDLAGAIRLYLVAHFFNTALPGNVAGDVLRAHGARAALPGGGAFVVVLLERVLGLAALMLLTSVVALVHGLATSRLLVFLTLAGIAGALLGASAPMVARAMGERLGGRLAEITRALPRLTSRRGIALALAQSLCTQALVALSGFAVLAGLAPSVSVLDALALLPLALLATYFPTVAGLGARELAFVALLAPLGVGEAEATAASLGLLGMQLVVAALGGVVHLFARRGAEGS